MKKLKKVQKQNTNYWDFSDNLRSSKIDQSINVDKEEYSKKQI